MTTSRQWAREWLYRGHRPYVKELQGVAEAWFKERGLAVHPRHPYILADHEKWDQNLLSEQVARYVCCEASLRRFPIHNYLHHGLSSQAMLFNLVGPLVLQNDLEPLLQALAQQGIAPPEGRLRATLEYADRDALNEDPRHAKPAPHDLADWRQGA